MTRVVVVPHDLVTQAVQLLRSYRETRDCGIMGHQQDTEDLVSELQHLADMAAPELPAGWVYPTATARRAHYYRAGSGRSLCGRWGYRGMSATTDHRDDDPENCQLCKERLAAGGD